MKKIVMFSLLLLLSGVAVAQSPRTNKTLLAGVTLSKDTSFVVPTGTYDKFAFSQVITANNDSVGLLVQAAPKNGGYSNLSFNINGTSKDTIWENTAAANHLVWGDIPVDYLKVTVLITGTAKVTLIQTLSK